MRKYCCDKCKLENTSTEKTYSNFEYPTNWITIKGGIIKNDTPYKGLEYCGGQELNFCGKNCFTEYFFGKEEKSIDNNLVTVELATQYACYCIESGNDELVVSFEEWIKL